MSNPWAQTYDDLRRPYLEEKKAKKDYDGDGKVESGSKEHAGAVHNAIQRAKGGKADGKDTRKEAFSMAADPEKRALPRPTKKAENKKSMSMRSRAVKAVGTQRRQDKEVGISGEKNPRAHRKESVWAGNYQGPLYAPWTAVEEGKKGLWANIHAKRKRGEAPAKKGDKDYPKTLNVEGNVEEGYKELSRDKRNKMFRKAGNLSRTALQGGDKGTEAGKKSGKIVKALNKDAEKYNRNDVKKEETAVQEGSMSAARKNVGASTCWKGYKAKGTKTKGGRTVPNCVKEHSDWREEMGDDGFFSEAAKRQNDLDIKTSGIKNKIEINPELKTEGACSDKPMERLKTDRDGYRVTQKDADAAKARIMAKTKKKREQAKENIMKGPLLPGEARKVFPKGAAPKSTGAKLPLQTASYNPMLDSVEAQALQMIERTRYAKETGKDHKTGKASEKGGTRDGKSAFDKVSRNMRKTGGMMSSRGKAIQPQGKKKDKGAKGYQGQTPVDKIKGQLAKKRAPKPNPYKPRAGESD